MADTPDEFNFSADTSTVIKNLLEDVTGNKRPGPKIDKKDPEIAVLEKHLEGLRDDMKSMIEESKRFGDEVVSLFRELKEEKEKVSKRRSRPSVKDAAADAGVVDDALKKAADAVEKKSDPTTTKKGRKKADVHDADVLDAILGLTKVFKEGGRARFYGGDGASASTTAVSEAMDDLAERIDEVMDDPHAIEKKTRKMYDKRHGYEDPFIHKSAFTGREERYHPSELIYNPSRSIFKKHQEEYDRKMAQRAFHLSDNPLHKEQGANPAFAESAGLAKLNLHMGRIGELANLIGDLKRGFMGIINVMDDPWRREMRKTAFQTEGISEKTPNLQDEFLGGKFRGEITEAIAITGRSNDEVKAMLLKNRRDGYRDAKDSFRMTKAALNASYVMGSNMEATNDYFKELHTRMGQSSASLNSVSISMQRIGRDMKITGDALLETFRAAQAIVKNMAKAGKDTIARTATINEMMVRFKQNNSKLDVTETAVKTLEAMQGMVEYFQSDDATKYYINSGFQGKNGAESNRKWMNGEMLSDKGARKDWAEQVGKTFTQHVNTLVGRTKEGRDKLQAMGVTDKDGKVIRNLTSKDLDKFSAREMKDIDQYSRMIYKMGAKEHTTQTQEWLNGTKTLSEKANEMRAEAVGASPERQKLVEENIGKMYQLERGRTNSQAEEMLNNTSGKTVDEMIAEYSKFNTPQMKEMKDQLREVNGDPNMKLDTPEQIKKALYANLRKSAADVGDAAVTKQIESALASGNKGELQAAIAALSEAQMKKNKEEVASVDPMDKAQKTIDYISGLLVNIRDSVNAIASGILGANGILAVAIGGAFMKAWSAMGFSKFWPSFGGAGAAPVPGAAAGGAGGAGAGAGAPGAAAGGAAAGGRAASPFARTMARWFPTMAKWGTFGNGARTAAGAAVPAAGAAAPGPLARAMARVPGLARLGNAARVLAQVVRPLVALYSGATRALDTTNAEKTLGKKWEEMTATEQGAATAGNWMAGAGGSVTVGLVDAVKDLGVMMADALGIPVADWLRNFSLMDAMGLGPDGKFTYFLTQLAMIPATIGEAIGSVAGKIINWWNGEQARGQKLDEAQKKNEAKQKSDGTYYAHNDPRNVKKDQWAAEEKRSKDIALGQDKMKGLVTAKDSVGFDRQAQETLKKTLEQKQRMDQGKDTWGATLNEIKAAKEKGIVLSPETEKMFQELTKRSEIDWMKSGVRADMTKSGLAIGKDGMTKELWDQKVEAEATKRYETKAATTVPGIPKLATGGLVTEGGLAVVGEAGPEWVIPADSFAERFAATVDPLPLAKGLSTGDSEPVPMPKARPAASPAPLFALQDQIEQMYLNRDAGGDAGAVMTPELGAISGHTETTNEKLDETNRLLRLLIAAMTPSGASPGTGSGRRGSTRANTVPPASTNYYNLAFGLRETPTKAYVNNYH